MIEVRNLSIGYDKKALLENISFSLEKGDFLCLLGSNGSGKSTLMKTMLGLMPPISGEILLEDGLRGEEIGYLGQQTQVQRDFPASVMEVVLSGCLGRGGFKPFYSKADKERARANMEKTGIWDLRDKCYRNLSGGQQQRVLLSRALCASSKVLFLDEPVSGLDPDSTARMYSILSDLNGGGMTILMISHDVDVSLRCVTGVLVLDHGIRRMTVRQYLDEVGGENNV